MSKRFTITQKILVFFSFFFLFLLFFQFINIKSAKASYAGDKDLTEFEHDVLSGGDIYYTLGNSTYSGVIDNNESYSVLFEVNCPSDAEIILSRIYFYWIWSEKDNEGVYPEVIAACSNEMNNWSGIGIGIDEEYSDTKGFVGLYDYYGGVYCYDVIDYIDISLDFLFIINNSAIDGRTFCTYGLGLLILYEEDEKNEKIEYWIYEGFDVLYADYGITSKQATTSITFEGKIDLEYVLEAELLTIVPAGGYYSNPDAKAPNRLLVNYEESDLPQNIKDFLEVLFGDVFTTGKKWEDIYYANSEVQIGIDRRDITDYLKSEDNLVQIQDNEDYLSVTNVILIVRYSDKPQNELILDAILGYLPYFLIFVFSIALIVSNRKEKNIRRFNFFGLPVLIGLIPFIIFSFIINLTTFTYSTSLILPFSSFLYFTPIVYTAILAINLGYFIKITYKKKIKKRKEKQLKSNLKELEKIENVEDDVFKKKKREGNEKQLKSDLKK